MFVEDAIGIRDKRFVIDRILGSSLDYLLPFLLSIETARRRREELMEPAATRPTQQMRILTMLCRGDVDM